VRGTTMPWRIANSLHLMKAKRGPLSRLNDRHLTRSNNTHVVTFFIIKIRPISIYKRPLLQIRDPFANASSGYLQSGPRHLAKRAAHDGHPGRIDDAPERESGNGAANRPCKILLMLERKR
jgi:hypothetical protein